MKFSIIIPAYKIQFINEAILSVINQSYNEFELLIFDDCSPENIFSVVSQYLNDERVKYFQNNHPYGAEALSQNWNNALQYCQGNYVICMGDDDCMLPNCLEEYSILIKKYPNTNVFHAQTEIIDENSSVIEYLSPRFEHENVWQFIYYRWAGCGRQQFIGDFCYKRDYLIKNGGFYNLPLAWGSDDITACIIANNGGIANSQKICFQYRKNSYSISNSGNNRLKVRALYLQREWYKKFLANAKVKTEEEKKFFVLLKRLFVVHFDFYIKENIRYDIKNKKSRVFYWLLNKSQSKLTTSQIFIQFLKSYI